MSLTSFLFNGDKKKSITIDKGLDDLFQSSIPQAGPSKPAQQHASNNLEHEQQSQGREGKRRLSVSTSAPKAKRARSEKDEEGEAPSTSEPRKAKKEKTSKSRDKKSAKRLVTPPVREAEDSDDEPQETAAHSTAKLVPPTARAGDDPDSGSDSDQEGDPSQLVHESVAKGVRSRSGGRSIKTKYVPPDETPERRNARTIFVGNVPTEVAKSRPAQKQLKRHILSFVPAAKIESIRYRSVAFQNPTSKLPSLDDDPASAKSQGKGKSVSSEKEKDGRQHDRDRAASWRATKGDDDDEPASGKVFLSPKEKKRIAFIRHEIHAGVDTVNAYVVFAHAPSADASARPANVPPPTPTLDPYEAARLAAERVNGSLFMERTLRADKVGRDLADSTPGAVDADPKATVFVGNLDFASKEEDLRVFFEGLVSAERGPPGEGSGESDEDEDEEDEGEEHKEAGVVVKKPRTWVKRVRIIRDKDTQLGKGFAYVQFMDRECVDEILAMEQDRLKFAKRKLRVQRCKTVPGSAKITPKFAKITAAGKLAAPSQRPRSASFASPAGPTPRGNPELGTKISHLPKDERKKVKAADADRVARRLAKKKAKLLAEKGVKARPDRERVRKRVGERKGDTGAQKEKRKSRVRSGNALAKMNTKK